MSDTNPQIAFWNSQASRPWSTDYARIDANFAVLTEELLAAAAPAQGESVLDIGCAAGTTVLLLAERVGPSGRVIGADVAEPSVAVAQARIAEAGLAQAQAVVADVGAHRFDIAFDLVFSRFGVMFFPDPVAAFVNVHAGTRPGGRLAFVCFRSPAENPWASAPFQAVRPLLPPQPPPDPHAPGQFAFADGARVRGILEAAGYRNVALRPYDPMMTLGTDAAQAANSALRFGPTARALTGAPQATQDQVKAALHDFFARHEKDGFVRLQGGVWIVTATA